MKTAQEWSAQIVDVEQSGEVCDVTVRFGDRAVVLQGLPPADAGALREILAAAIRARVEEADAGASPAILPATQAAPTPADQADGNSRLLYGLPCPQCGAYFESRLQACPVCCPADAPERKQETAVTRNSEPQLMMVEGHHFGDLLREGLGTEIAEACVRYGARMERMEAALRMTSEEAARTIYEALFPSQARKQPWEKCPHDFRSAYVLRVGVLLQELRRRAGLEPLADSEFIIEAGSAEMVPVRLAN